MQATNYSKNNRRNKRDLVWGAGLILLLLIVCFFSLTFEISEPCQTLLAVIKSYDSTVKEQVILLSRISRVSIALFAGSALALSGLLMQLHYRNTLADPSLMGVNDGAALAVILILVFFSDASMPQRIIASIAGASVAYLMIQVGLKKVRVHHSPLALPLVGLIVSMILGSLTTLIASYFNLSQSMTSWYSSRLYRVEWQQVRYFILPLLIAIVFIAVLRKQFTVYRYDHDLTVAIGMERKKFELILQALVVVLTGVTVAIAGRIAFVGLIVPHMARLVYGNRYEKLIIYVPLVGAVMVVAADYLGRYLNYPFETPVGIMFAMIGVPIFLWLIRSGKGGDYNV